MENGNATLLNQIENEISLNFKPLVDGFFVQPKIIAFEPDSPVVDFKIEKIFDG